MKRKIKTHHFQIPICLQKNPNSWANSLSDIGFDSIELSPDSLHIKKFQSFDFLAKPNHYIYLIFSKSNLCASYTYSDSRPSLLQKIAATKTALLCLRVLDAPISNPKLFSHINSILDDCYSLIPLSTASLSQKNQELQKNLHCLNQKFNSLSKQSQKDSKELLQRSKTIDTLRKKISNLEKIPDDILDEQILNWLAIHGGEICMQDFCKAHSISPARLEQGLNRLSEASKIRRI